MRNFLDDSIVEHQSKPPLRWIANLAGGIASKGLLEISYMEDVGYKGWEYKYYSFVWDKLWPIYQKYGTFYRLRMDLSGKEWDDYDENGVPYWEKFHWDFIDEETGDAFKVIKI